MIVQIQDEGDVLASASGCTSVTASFEQIAAPQAERRAESFRPIRKHEEI